MVGRDVNHVIPCCPFKRQHSCCLVTCGALGWRGCGLLSQGFANVFPPTRRAASSCGLRHTSSRASTCTYCTHAISLRRPMRQRAPNTDLTATCGGRLAMRETDKEKTKDQQGGEERVVDVLTSHTLQRFLAQLWMCVRQWERVCGH